MMSEIKPVAYIFTPYKVKFGIPRQSGLVPNTSKIVFQKEFRSADAVRGLEEFSHLWLIWEFSENKREAFSPTVRPPRLGGNTRRGVFATRASFRPNSLALSAVKLLKIDFACEEAPVLYVEGADLLDGTPIFDIKPYLPFTDSIPDAKGGFAAGVMDDNAEVSFLCDVKFLSAEEKKEILAVLSQDPRPHYQEDPDRVYSFEYGNYHIEFTGDGRRLRVTDIKKVTE